jgi:hypothetical protein
MYDGKPMKVTRPVVVGHGKIVHRQFTIDNTLPVRRAFSGAVLQDMGKIEADPSKHADKPSYAFFTPNSTHSSSIPKRLHGLPERTRHKAGYEPEDLRREAYE